MSTNENKTLVELNNKPVDIVQISPSNILTEQNGVECSCESHPKHFVGVFDAPVNVNTLFDLIFTSKSNLLLKLAHTKKENEDLTIEPWFKDDDDNMGARKLTYTIKYKAPLNIFTQISRATEMQYITQSDPDRVYSVSVSISTPDVPSGDNFLSVVRYCFRALDEKTSRLSVTGGVTFSKRNILSKKIEVMSVEGSISFYNIVKDLLNECEFEEEKLKLIYTVPEPENVEITNVKPTIKNDNNDKSTSYFTNEKKKERMPFVHLVKNFFSLFGTLIISLIIKIFNFAFSYTFFTYSFALICLSRALLNAFTCIEIVSSIDSHLNSVYKYINSVSSD